MTVSRGDEFNIDSWHVRKHAPDLGAPFGTARNEGGPVILSWPLRESLAMAKLSGDPFGVMTLIFAP